MKKIIFLGGFFALIIFLFPKNVYAVSKVVINELMWTGSEVSSSDEWIELRNLTDYEIDLSGFKIKYSDDNEMVSISSGKIPANGYFLIANSSCDHNYSDGESILNITPDYIDSGISLSNSSLQIKLVDSTDQIIDIAGDGNKPLAGNNEKKYSMERNDIITDGALSSSWHTATESINLDISSIAQATPGHANSPPVFSPITHNYTDLDRYIDINNCLESSAQVTNIVDGDTIDIDLNGEITRIRLLGINSPDSAKYSDFKIDEPYYEEAKQFLINNILDENINIIVTSDSNEQYDSYDRLLALIVLDQEIINISSIKNGLSKAYYLDNPILVSTGWVDEEKKAQQNQVGLWKYYGENVGLYINEIMPNPKGSDAEGEWIELYNSSKKDIDLTNWFLDDSKYGSDPYLFPEETIIESDSYLVIKITESNISLNNSSDSVRLFSLDLNIYHEMSYEEYPKEGISYMRNDSGLYQWTKKPTPGNLNIYSDPDRPDYEKIDKISDLSDKKADDYVEVEGYVNSEDHQLSDQYFYIEDSSGGVQIYNYYKDFPDLKVGQKIKIFGQMSDSNILRVKIDSKDDIIILNQTTIFEPPRLSPKNVNKSLVGRLVSVEAKVSKLSGQTFYISDSGNTLKIQIRGPTGFTRPDLTKDDLICVTGVLYESYNGNLTLLPRFLSDIKIITHYEKNSEDNPIIINRISDLVFYNEDDFVLIRGYVNSIPGMFSERYFYIQDDTAGVEIYSHYKIFPDLDIGDYVEIIGKLSASKDRIKTYNISDFNIVNKDHPIKPINIDEQTNIKTLYGMFVNIKGVIISKKNNNFVVTVNGVKFTVNFKDFTNIKPSLLKVGDRVDISGIVGRYQDQYKIHPRSIDDILYQRQAKSVTKINDNKKTIIKSYSRVKHLPRIDKYLVNSPQKKYNMVTIRNIVKTILIVLQLVLLIIIIEWLCKKQLSSKI